MFLALHEMKYEKLRYSLIIAVISLITFLIFIISALALGLANENTDAINSWQTKSVLLTKDSNGNMGQSLMTPEELDPYMNDNHQAIVGITPTTLKDKNHNESIQFVGLRSDEYIAKELQLNSGKKPTQKNEVLISDKLTHYQIGDKIQLGLDSHKYTISGIVKHAQYNMAPVVYGAISNWSAIKGVNPQYLGSGVISKNDQSLTTLNDNFKVLGKSAYLDKLPGYAAQNSTFAFMIIFLILISLIVVTIFLYILTIQKRPNLAVLRAQGIPNTYLLRNTLSETFIIMSSAIMTGAIFTLLVALFIPETVPMYFSLKLSLGVAIGILITGLIGSLIPIWIISKIDPVSVIGG